MILRKQEFVMKRVVITGATSGIGLAITRELGEKGYELIIGCRNITKGLTLVKELKDKNMDVTLLEVDLADLSSIKKFSQNLLEQYSSIDVLINNAGVFSDTKKVTKDGFELTIGTNFIGQVSLTEKLLTLLTVINGSRIVNISSEAALFGRIKTDKSFYTKPAKGFLAYSKSKLAQVLYTLDLAERLSKQKVVVNAVPPGHVNTNIWKGDSFLMKIVGPVNQRKALSPETAAKICIEVALADEYSQVTGQLIDHKGIMTLNRHCLDVELRKKVMLLASQVIRD